MSWRTLRVPDWKHGGQGLMVILDVIYVLHIKFKFFCINLSFLAGLEVYQEPYCPHSKGSLINFKTILIFGKVFCKIFQLISHLYQFLTWKPLSSLKWNLKPFGNLRLFTFNLIRFNSSEFGVFGTSSFATYHNLMNHPVFKGAFSPIFPLIFVSFSSWLM